MAASRPFDDSRAAKRKRLLAHSAARRLRISISRLLTILSHSLDVCRRALGGTNERCSTRWRSRLHGNESRSTDLKIWLGGVVVSDLAKFRFAEMRCFVGFALETEGEVLAESPVLGAMPALRSRLILLDLSIEKPLQPF